MLFIKPSFSTSKIIIFLLGFFTFISLTQKGFCASTSWQKTKNDAIENRLIISAYQNQNDKKIIGAIHFKIKDGWKIYGKDVDGIGMLPTIDFKGSNNYKFHEVFFPKPEIGEEKIGKDTIKYSYYKHEVLIPFSLELDELKTQNNINLKLNFAYCNDVCIPHEQEFSLAFDDKIDQKSLRLIQKFYDQDLGLEKIETNSQQQQTITVNNKPILLILFFAFIGGLILNVMPCVLPVISIKLMSVINHSQDSLKKIRLAFLSTFLGILSCFIILALIAITLKLTGNSLGWGLQFQNPYFIIFIIIILIFFTAEFLDIFTINFNQLIASLLVKKIHKDELSKNIFIPNFLSGVLAVLLATPCSAPFLGSAISFALTQESFGILLIFTVIGIGFAMPYLILMLSPKMSLKLPKPGRWMYRVKQIMAGFLMATIIWLIYILSKNIGVIPAYIIAFLSIGIFAFLSAKGKIKKIIFIGCLIFLSFTLPFEYKENQDNIKAEDDSLWIEFSEKTLEDLIIQDKVILVDVTADWCITCKFNKLRILKSKEIIDKLKSGEIIGLRADLTSPNKKIMDYMKKFNRFAIPFNVVYGPNAKEGILTSELLSKEELLNAIEQAQ
jgi:suppressor for copper-sensitivity B